MTDKEKIRAEIERRMNMLEKYKGSFDTAAATFQELQDLLAFLGAIEAEEKEVDLDREIIRYKVPFSDEREYLNETTLDAIAHHFYELGCRHTAVMYDDIEYERQRAEEAEITKGLEEEISSYWSRVTGYQPKFAVLELTKDDLAKVARHFYELGLNSKMK